MMQLLFVLTMMNAPTAFAQEFVEKSFTGESTAKTAAQARREITDQATQNVIEELSREYLGEDKFNKSKATLLPRLQRQSARVVPYSKPGPLTQKNEVYQMTVALRVNPLVLKQILQEMGMLDEGHTSPVVLPLISFHDSVQRRTHRWWMLADSSQDLAFLKSLNRPFENQLQESMRNSQFHLIKPLSHHLSPSVPAGLRTEKPPQDALRLFSQWFQAPLIIEGSVDLRASPADSSRTRIEVKLSVVQASNGRVVADVVRHYDTDRGAFETTVAKKWREALVALTGDLANQIQDASQRGSLGSSQIRLVVHPRPPLPEIESLKEALRGSNAGIRTIFERVISAEDVVFEVNSQLSATEIAGRLKKASLKGHVLDASARGDGEISARWSKVGGAK